ncbi:MAG: lipopolysaccharide assembly protein LapA domain-containing protein [Carnobacterium sp.]
MIILAVLLLVLVGVVAFLNTEMILINFYFMTFTLPLWLALIGTLLIGMVIAALLANGARNRQVVKNKDKELDRSETERKEAVDRVKKESEAQLEIQKKEAEIQRLSAELSSAKESETKPISETLIKEVPIGSRVQKKSNKDLKVEEYQVDLPEENQSDETIK